MRNPGHLMIWTLALVALLTSSTPAQSSATKENQIKAALLYNFAQLVEWPAGAFAGADAPFVIGFLGDHELRGMLEQATADKKAQGRAISVKLYGSASELGPCHILFVANAQNLQAALDKLAGASVLTVGESDAFLDGGGVIRFLLEEGKVRFQIKQANADKAKLKIDPKLQKLAKS